MAKKNDPAVAGIYEVEPHVDEAWKPIEVTPDQRPVIDTPVTPPTPSSDGPTKSPDAGENPKEK